jgi:hypothetical protein
VPRLSIGSHRRVSLAIVAIILGLMSGCAVNNFGSLAGSVRLVQGGWVMDIYTLGLHLRPVLTDDAGVTLGFSRRSSVFANDEVASPRTGWYVFRIPAVPGERALIYDVETLGVDVHFGRPEPGVTVGLQRVTTSRRQPIEGSHFHHVVYFPGLPERTCVSTDWEQPC